ncbi:DoxX family protein [Ferruginibacter lapsinanis]|uniref:DoxX family protein n=1 Tax=Ferruginibacter lapsinanis TaxID=563172 RepID=UPI001E64E69E|nr:DoxX family protein [Ferruginibacter lapsinanis]UEG49668.1 DoxX family protein [Ferruginibacter lapsinanis]
MKKTKIIYWVFTILFAAFMAFTAIPDVRLTPEAVAFMKTLGYLDYFTRFIGVAKILGCIAILIPGFPKIKEWAYAGLFFDLIGATYSVIAIYGVSPQISFMLLPFALGIISYIYNNKVYNN